MFAYIHVIDEYRIRSIIEPEKDEVCGACRPEFSSWQENS
jgi:hypothetical protein